MPKAHPPYALSRMIRIGNNCRTEKYRGYPCLSLSYRAEVAVGAVGALRNVRVNA